MRIKCIRAGKAKGLTNGKVYSVLDLTELGYLILNDLGLFQYYKTNRFAINNGYK